MRQTPMILLTLSLLASALTCPAPAPAADDDGFVPLFDGKSLDGWTQKNGKAKYDVVDGVIVGTAVPNTPNSFLCTKKTYGDFILELDFKVDPELNSGVQIRSESRKDYRDFRVHGYQVEIDPSKRAWSGGIYDEGRRGWLNNLVGNDKARKAFKQGQWNHFRIEAIGDHIRTWLNGVPAADLVDSMTIEGFIALQVHGVGRNKDRVGKQVCWRNIRIKDLGRRTWEPMWDGKTLAGWHALPGGKWEVKDGAIVGTSPKTERLHGLLASDKEYADFTVRVTFQCRQGNSGFYFRSDEVKSAVGVNGFQAEVDTGEATGGLYETGGRAWVAQVDPKVLKKAYRKTGWNQMTVSAHGKRIVVHLNGVKTAELKNDPGRAKGRFALQLHGGMDMDVSFKSIEMLSEAKK